MTSLPWRRRNWRPSECPARRGRRSPSQTAHSASPCFGQSVFESKHAEEKPPLSRTTKHRGSCRWLGFSWNFSFNTRCTNSPGAAGAPSPPTVPPPWPLPWSVCEAYFKEKMHPEGALAQERCSLLHDKPRNQSELLSPREGRAEPWPY